jgi:hypothetical protein
MGQAGLQKPWAERLCGLSKEKEKEKEMVGWRLGLELILG